MRASKRGGEIELLQLMKVSYLSLSVGTTIMPSTQIHRQPRTTYVLQGICQGTSYMIESTFMGMDFNNFLHFPDMVWLFVKVQLLVSYFGISGFTGMIFRNFPDRPKFCFTHFKSCVHTLGKFQCYGTFCTHGTTLHGRRNDREMKRCSMKGLIT